MIYSGSFATGFHPVLEGAHAGSHSLHGGMEKLLRCGIRTPLNAIGTATNMDADYSTAEFRLSIWGNRQG